MTPFVLAFVSLALLLGIYAFVGLPFGSRILVVAPNASLPAALVGPGYEVTLWHVAHGIITPELANRAERTGSLDELLSATFGEGDGRFEVIVLPFVLEAADYSWLGAFRPGRSNAAEAVGSQLPVQSPNSMAE